MSTITSSICSIATCTPANGLPQRDIGNLLSGYQSMNEKESEKLQKLFDKSGVSFRYSVLLDQEGRMPLYEENPIPKTSRRMEIYSRYAPQLAVPAAQQAIDESPYENKEITHLVTVSCTGFDAPSVDIDIIKACGLSHQIERTHIGFMGCHGAINALKIANSIVQSSPESKVLVVSVELCSLHFSLARDSSAQVGNSLFSDGAAACIVAHHPDAQGFSFLDSFSSLFPDSEDELRWSIGDFGFSMELSARLPNLIERSLSIPYNRELLVHFALHPGGARVLEAMQRKLELNNKEISHSVSVLSDYGNMSSATCIFVLQKIQQQEVIKGPLLLLGLGPGVWAEGCLLEWSGK